MIELLWNDLSISEKEAMLNIARIYVWLLSEMLKDEQLKIYGFMMVRDEERKIAGLVMNEGGDVQQRLLKILQQPPEPYAGKYNAQILCEEPNPVVEKKDESDDEEEVETKSGEINIELT